MSEERVARVATAIFNEIFPRTTGRAIPATMVGEYVDLAKAAIAAHEAALAAAGLVIVPLVVPIGDAEAMLATPPTETKEPARRG